MGRRTASRVSAVALVAGLVVTGVVGAGDDAADPAIAASAIAPAPFVAIPRVAPVAPEASAAAAAAPLTVQAAGHRRKVRKLWGRGKGRFRTRGRYGAATVRGSIDPRPAARIRAYWEDCDVWFAQVAAGLDRPRPNELCLLDVWIDGRWVQVDDIPTRDSGGSGNAHSSGTPSAGSGGSSSGGPGDSSLSGGTPRDGQPPIVDGTTSDEPVENGPTPPAEPTSGESGSGDGGEFAGGTGGSGSGDPTSGDGSTSDGSGDGDCWVVAGACVDSGDR